MVVLGLDTCLDACSAAVVEGGRTLARAAEPMSRGHQERLAPLAEMVVAQAGLAFNRIARVGVTVGPGSFTGLRVGLAFAKGLGQALDIPVVGVGTLTALAYGLPGLAVAAIDARRGQVYLQIFEAGSPLTPPEALSLEAAFACLAEVVGASPFALVGSGAALIAPSAPNASVVSPAWADPAAVARIAAGRDATPPRPLYLRAPDARLPTP